MISSIPFSDCLTQEIFVYSRATRPISESGKQLPEVHSSAPRRKLCLLCREYLESLFRDTIIPFASAYRREVVTAFE